MRCLGCCVIIKQWANRYNCWEARFICCMGERAAAWVQKPKITSFQNYQGALSQRPIVSDLITTSALLLMRSLGGRTWISGCMISRSQVGIKHRAQASVHECREAIFVVAQIIGRNGIEEICYKTELRVFEAYGCLSPKRNDVIKQSFIKGVLENPFCNPHSTEEI